MNDLRRSSSTYTESLFLHVVKRNLFFFFFNFFSVSLFFREYSRFTGQHVESISLYPFNNFHPPRRHLDISWVVAAKSSPLRIAGSQNPAWNFWYTLFRVNSQIFSLVHQLRLVLALTFLPLPYLFG